MLEAAAFAVGAVLGSFANVLVYRLPRGESLLSPGSRCPGCGTPILPWDNIPVVSYLILRGRCRRCGRRIPVRYLVIELAAGALFAGLAWRFGVSLLAVRFAVLALLLVVVTATDLEQGLIPNAVTYPGIALGLALSAASGVLLSSLAAAAGAGAVFLVIALVSRGGMGGGDVKLAAMIGAYLGAPGVIVALFLAVALGALTGLALLALRLRTRKQSMPFGPSLAAGALIAMFASHDLVRWYLTAWS